MNLHTVRNGLALPVVALSLVACPQAATTPPAITASTVTVHEAHLSAPATLSSGLNRVTLTNTVAENRDVVVVKLNGGVTVQDLLAALNADGFPAVLTKGELASGRSLPVGASRVSVFDLEPGVYAFVATEDGLDPAAVFYGTSLTVTARTGLMPVAPTGTKVVTAVDFNLTFPTTLPAGTTTFEFRNEGTQWHEFLVFKLAPGKTEQDLVDFFSSPPSGPPPFEFADVIIPMSPGNRVFADISLEPGNYVAICQLPDLTKLPQEVTLHVQHGMHRAFTVQ